MLVEFDAAKDAENIRKHGISLQRAAEFNMDSAVIRVDDREDYGEIRFRAVGLLNGRSHVLVFTMRGETLRAISLRAATRQEVRQYDEDS